MKNLLIKKNYLFFLSFSKISSIKLRSSKLSIKLLSVKLNLNLINLQLFCLNATVSNPWTSQLIHGLNLRSQHVYQTGPVIRIKKERVYCS